MIVPEGMTQGYRVRGLLVEERAVPKERPRVGRGHAWTPERTVAWAEQVGWAWKGKHRFAEPYRGRVSLLLAFFFSQRVTAADLDNLVKGVSDALNGLAYVDDRQVDALIVRRYKAERDAVSIVVAEMGSEVAEMEPREVYSLGVFVAGACPYQ